MSSHPPHRSAAIITFYEKPGCGNNSKQNALLLAADPIIPSVGARFTSKKSFHPLGEIGGLGEFPKQTEQGIKKIFQTLSPWDAVKHAGRSALR